MADSTQVTQELIFRMMESNNNLVSNWLIWSSVVVVLFGIIGALFQFYLNTRKVSNEVEKHIHESKLKFEAELEKKVKSLKSDASTALEEKSKELSTSLETELSAVRNEMFWTIIQSHHIQAIQWQKENRIQEAYLSIQSAIFFSIYFKADQLDEELKLALEIIDDAESQGVKLKRALLGSSEQLAYIKTKTPNMIEFERRNKNLSKE